MKVELVGGLNVLTDLTREEKARIKDGLTLPNPVYAQVKAYSKFAYTSIPPDLFFFKSIGGALLVPRGYRIPFKAKRVIDKRVEVTTKYPKLRIQLRDTQQTAYNEWRRDPDKGVTILPTGKGKSIYGAYLAYAKKQRALIIVQKNDLVDGWKSDIMTMFNLRPKKIGLIKASTFRIGEQYTITTIQTLSKLSSEELATLYDKFGMIICDEFHHSPANSYNILKYFKAKYYVGLTATDMREDGLEKVLYWMFGDVCYRHPETEDDEDIMPYSVIIKNSNIDYNPPDKYDDKGRRIPTNSAELKRVIASSSSFNHLVATDIKKEYECGKSCIAFLHEKEHIRYLADLLERIGVPSDQIQLYYGDSKEKDSVMKKRAESKEVLVTLATFAKATEGTNIKTLERGFIITPIKSEKNFIQAIGRCRRRKKGKKDVIIYYYHHPNIKSVRNYINNFKKVCKNTNGTIVSEQKEYKPIVRRGWGKY